MDKPIIFFDGYCNFCNGLVNFIIDHNPKKNLLFCSLQSETGKKHLRISGLSEVNHDTILLWKEGKYHIKSTAVFIICKDLNTGWKIFYYLIFIPRFIRDFGYDIVARNRYRIFGKREQCRIPEPEVLERFIV